MQQNHRVASAREKIVQPRAVDIGKSALYRLRGFKRSRFLSNRHELFFSENSRKYPTAPMRTQQVVSSTGLLNSSPACMAAPIGCSMPESSFRAWLPMKLRRLKGRLFWSYLYEAPRTD